MYAAMTQLGHAQESPYKSPVRLEGAPRGATVLVLGAGLSGMVAAHELRRAGYHVRVLEYNDRVGGRCWTLRGGDRYTELGGATQHCAFAQGEYFNPGPWRIPYHHHAVLDYCKRLGVRLEPFIQQNQNAYLHSKDAFGGQPQRFRHIQADFQGHVAELLAKAVQGSKLDAPLSAQDTARLLEALRSWGVLDKDYAYRKGHAVSNRRGFAKDAGGGLNAAPVPSTPLGPADLLQSGLWARLGSGSGYEFSDTMLQPVGGMDMIARALGKGLDGMIRFNAQVTAIRQDANGVTVAYTDRARGQKLQASAQWCVCTLPLSILSQVEMNVSDRMASAIAAVPYSSSVKTGLQFKRRFWEEDDAIFGGVSYTDLPIRLISYPSNSFQSGRPGVVLGCYVARSPAAYEWSSLPPAERVARAVEFGAQVHPQYRREFDNGISVAWHRVPWALGCAGMWTDATRQRHYDDLCAVDGRIVLAGEHASHLPAWQEGAILSSLDAISRLHARAVAAPKGQS